MNSEKGVELTKDKYHHGDLKKDLITKGLQLLNREGMEGLSLRKVAVLCGVSHAAPYKHFKDKEELVAAITAEVLTSFKVTLETATRAYPDDPKLQLLALGRQYVQFMVENPDYLRFLFLSGHSHPIQFYDGDPFPADDSVFEIFKKSAEKFLESINSRREDRIIDILTMWSLVHGFAVLMVNRSIEIPGDYLEMVSKMVSEKLIFT